MKKFLLILSTFSLLTAALFAASFQKGDSLYVSEKSVTLKSGTGLFAKNSGELFYGDNVLVMESKGKKIKVQLASDSSIQGWILSSNLTNKKIVKEGNAITQVDELALAGKGDRINSPVLIEGMEEAGDTVQSSQGENPNLQADGAALKEEGEKIKKNIKDAK